MREENRETIVYTIIHATANAENESFNTSTAQGCYLSLSAARKELEKQISVEKERAPKEYDCEECREDFWEMYQDGFAAAAYSRLVIVSAILHCDGQIQPSQ